MALVRAAFQPGVGVGSEICGVLVVRPMRHPMRHPIRHPARNAVIQRRGQTETAITVQHMFLEAGVVQIKIVSVPDKNGRVVQIFSSQSRTAARVERPQPVRQPMRQPMRHPVVGRTAERARPPWPVAIP